MALRAVTLDDKYVLDRGRVYLTGTQALVRLPMMQRQRDVAAGLNTGCFISGYRGSPLGGLDQALWGARRFLERNHIRFQPAINEELGATAIWGSQQLGLFPGAKYDGVFAMWYAKGPGVDRSGDALKHGNSAGSAPHGGVLLLAGDDHTCKSSTLAHQSEYAFMDACIPVLNPSGVQEILDLGLYGWAMSRYSGCWIAFKTIAETVDSSASVDIAPERTRIVSPEDFEMPPGGLNIRWPDQPLEQEYRLHKYKLYAALAFARANRLDRIVIDSPSPRFGIVTTGKSYLDVRQALDDLGIDEAHAAEIGIRLYKVAMSWPLEREGIRHFAEGLEEILVVEEKRAVIENQFKEQLYNWREDVRPRVIGKFDENRNWILPSNGELTPAQIARVIAQRIGRFYTSPRIVERLAFLEAKERQLGGNVVPFARTPYFCSGCPHNTSTKVPEGSRAVAGIGCHYLAQFMDRSTATFTQMGGEGTPWIGQAPFTETPHIFANLGDGTYTHSGVLAIRAAVAAKVNITYKLLFNDAVAMTGGQPLDGGLSVPVLTRQLAAEGVGPIVVVTDEPDKYPLGVDFAAGVTVRHRDDLDMVQRDLRVMPGVSAIVYDQTCAAEKRRRRKRGRFPDPAKRVFINDLVCEGCGDCSKTSNCLSVVPVETEFGRKRAIDQSSCNKDYSCVEGFCPSFVTVHGGGLKKGRAGDLGEDGLPALPEPAHPALDEPYGILVTGVGGTGVVTIGALLGMAAHLEGKGLHDPRHDRARAEGRCGLQPCPDRPRARRNPCGAHRRRRRQIAARLRSRGFGQRRRAVEARTRPQPRHHQQPRNHHRRFHAQSGSGLSDQCAGTQHRRGDRSGKRRVCRRDATGDRPLRRFDRQQSVHARLCLSARAGAIVGRGHRARDRLERRRRRIQSRRVPLGAARGDRSDACRSPRNPGGGDPGEPPPI